jgi:hypothetical protein
MKERMGMRGEWMFVLPVVICAMVTAMCAVGAIAQENERVVEPATGVAFDRFIGTEPRLELTGVAVRKRFWIDVYAVGVYVDRAAFEEYLAGRKLEGEELAEALLAAPVRSAQEIVFVRNIDEKRVREGVIEGVERTLSASDPRIAKDMVTLLKISDEAIKGDRVVTFFEPDGVIVIYVNGILITFMKNEVLAHALKAVYLGENALDKKIKRDVVGLLGIQK